MTMYDLISRVTSMGYNIRVGIYHEKCQIAVFDGDQKVVRFSMSAQLPLEVKRYEKQEPWSREQRLVDLIFDYLNTPINER